MAQFSYSVKLGSGDYLYYTVVGEQSLLSLSNRYASIDQIKRILERSTIYPRYRIFVLNNDETIQYQIPPEDILEGGSYSENYQNGSRRTLSFSLDNTSGKYTPSINTFWLNTKVLLEVGLEVPDEAITIWFKKGVFVLNEAKPSKSPDRKTVSLDFADKYSLFESKCGTVPVSTEIPVGTNIKDVFLDTLGYDMGNGDPMDTVSMIYHPSFKDKKTPLTISLSAGSTWSSLFQQLAEILSAEIFYDAEGHFNVLPITETMTDGAKPVLYDFSIEANNLMDENMDYGMSNIVNCIYVVGANVDGHTCMAKAENNSPSSRISIGRIGRRVGDIVNDSNIMSDTLAQERADYELRQKSIITTTLSGSVPFNPLLTVNNMVTFTDEDFDYECTRFLLQSQSFSLGYDGTMSVSVSSMNDFSELEAQFKKQPEYEISVESDNIIEGENNPTQIYSRGTATLTFSASVNWHLPDAISVANASYTWDRSTGTLILSNPTDNVTVEISGAQKITVNDVRGTSVTTTDYYVPNDQDTSIPFSYSPTNGYVAPATGYTPTSSTGITSEWTFLGDTNGRLTIHPTTNGTVTVTAMACYSITVTTQNCTADAGNATYVRADLSGTITLSYSFTENTYWAPTSVSLDAPHATAEWTYAQTNGQWGEMELSAPTGNISYTVAAIPGYRVDIIQEYDVGDTNTTSVFVPASGYAIASQAILTRGDYAFPFLNEMTISGVNATVALDSRQISATFTLSNATNGATITIPMGWRISVTKDHCSLVDGYSLAAPRGGDCQLEFSFESGYQVPSSNRVFLDDDSHVSSYGWNGMTQKMSLNGVTGPISFSIRGFKLPAEGALIKMHLYNDSASYAIHGGPADTYRVLRAENGVNHIKVMAMYAVGSGTGTYGSSVTYEGSDIDNYLSNTWSKYLSDKASKSLVNGTVYQSKYPTRSGYEGGRVPSSKADYANGTPYSGPLQRSIRLPNLDDVYNYFGEIWFTADNIKEKLFYGYSGTADFNAWTMDVDDSEKVDLYYFRYLVDSSGYDDKDAIRCGSQQSPPSANMDVRPVIWIDISSIPWELAT